MAFGCFVKMPGFLSHGLVHLSQLMNYKVDKVEDVVEEGDDIWVKVANVQ